MNSGIACAQEAANREADARGWDPVAVDSMLQRWRSPLLHCCRQPSRCCSSWRKRPEPTRKRERSTTPRRSPTWQARHSRPRVRTDGLGETARST
ncbi:MAG: hypothetical protein ACK56F_15375, partial [bacterium]